MASTRKLTRQQYESCIEALDLVKHMAESSSSLAERRYARSILPGPNYHVALIDRLQGVSDLKAVEPSDV